MPMTDLEGRRFKPNIHQTRMRWRVIPTEDIGSGKIVLANGDSGASMEVALASSATAACSTAPLFLTRHSASQDTRAILEVVEVGLMRSVNTNGASVGDPVYLSTAGGFTLTYGSSGARRQIGTVLEADSTAGVILFDGRLQNGRNADLLYVNGVIIANGAAFGTVSVGTAWNGATVYGMALQAVPTNATVNPVAGAVTTGTLRVDLTGDPGASGALCNCILFKGTADVTDS